jgi:transposase-like protein
MIDRRIVTRYSETFKRKVVEELESGKLATVSEARRRYGIGGALTIQGWIKRLGRNHLLGKVVRVETLEEGREIERLRRQVRDLEHALAQTRMKELLAEAQFEVLCERQGIADVEGEKKKAAAELSRRRGKRPGDGPQQ